MEPKRAVTGILAKVAISGVFLAGAAAVTPSIYHDVSTPSSSTTMVVGASTTNSTSSPDIYHDV
jgi:hypothetical protein